MIVFDQLKYSLFLRIRDQFSTLAELPGECVVQWISAVRVAADCHRNGVPCLFNIEDFAKLASIDRSAFLAQSIQI